MIGDTCVGTVGTGSGGASTIARSLIIESDGNGGLSCTSSDRCLMAGVGDDTDGARSAAKTLVDRREHIASRTGPFENHIFCKQIHRYKADASWIDIQGGGR